MYMYIWLRVCYNLVEMHSSIHSITHIHTTELPSYLIYIKWVNWKRNKVHGLWLSLALSSVSRHCRFVVIVWSAKSSSPSLVTALLGDCHHVIRSYMRTTVSPVPCQVLSCCTSYICMLWECGLSHPQLIVCIYIPQLYRLHTSHIAW